MKFIRALYLATAFSLSLTNVMAQAPIAGYFLHTVTKGQSLYSISSMYNVTMADIIRINPGSDKSIRTGEKLKIPQIEKVSEKKFHTIKSGETLYKLTTIYGVSANEICNANPGLSADNFKIGQVIVIPAQSEQDIIKNAVNVNANAGVIEKQEQKYQTIHKVSKKETIYSISQKYGITQEELINANSELKTGELKKGDHLRIPYHTIQTNKVIPTNSELFSSNRVESHKFSTIKVAVLLPFMTNGENHKEQAKMVEYYEGFLMAVDSLKRQGESFDIYTYDTGSNESSLKTILAKPEMKNMNIIFGPAYPEQATIVSKFAEKNKIRLVIPFTSKNNDVYTNPYVYQVNSPQSYLYSQVYEHFIRTFHNANVIFVDTEDKNSEKDDFIAGMKNELRNNNVHYTQLKGSNITQEEIMNVVSPIKNNIFVPVSGSNVTLIKFLPQLLVTSRENPEVTIKLFGYPEWQTYTQDHLNQFYELDTYFYTSFYSNNLFANSAKFSSDFRKLYSKTLASTYPKYGMLGFDTGYYFLKALSTFGTNVDNNINKVYFSPVQNGFKFSRVNNWGGFINKKVFFVHYSKKGELVKLDFDK